MISTIVNIYCDKCTNDLETGMETEEYALEYAQRMKWTTTKDGKDLCPRCSKIAKYSRL